MAEAIGHGVVMQRDDQWVKADGKVLADLRYPDPAPRRPGPAFYDVPAR